MNSQYYDHQILREKCIDIQNTATISDWGTFFCMSQIAWFDMFASTSTASI